MSLTPLFNKVLVSVEPTRETKVGGILIPESARKTTTVAKVIAVGEGSYQYGTLVPPTVKPGDEVLIPVGFAVEVEVDGKKLGLINEVDIFGVIS